MVHTWDGLGTEEEEEMTLSEIAQAEGIDTVQVFVRASRLFGKGSPSPSGDHARWVASEVLPSYVSEYVRYWTGFHRTETTRSRSRL